VRFLNYIRLFFNGIKFVIEEIFSALLLVYEVLFAICSITIKLVIRVKDESKKNSHLVSKSSYRLSLFLFFFSAFDYITRRFNLFDIDAFYTFFIDAFFWVDGLVDSIFFVSYRHIR
jgi:hypothetical protein